MPYFKITLIAIAVISVITFILYGIDKYRARRGLWRVPERVLLGFSLLGGAVGGMTAMHLFRHKTKHWYFTVLNVLGIILQAGLLVYLLVAFGI